MGIALTLPPASCDDDAMTNIEFDSDMHLIANATDAFSMLDRLTNCDCPDERLPRERLCIHFHASSALRELLIDRDAQPRAEPADTAYPKMRMLDDDPDAYAFIRALLARIDAAPYMTQRLSMLALDHSLCPMHFIDYAICFDDDDPDCASIRDLFPDHDT